MKTALIFDPGYGGHHLKYVALLVQAYHGAGFAVRFASGARTFTSTEYDTVLKPYASLFEAVPLAALARGGGLVGRLRKSRHLLRLAARTAPDVLFVPYLDDLFYVYGLVAPALRRLGVGLAPTSGILMHCEFAHAEHARRPGRRLKAGLCARILRSGVFRRVLLIDEIAHEFLVSRVPSGGLTLCPDPVEAPPRSDPAAARERLGLPLQGRVLGVFGVLTEAKGIGGLVRAYLQYRPGPDECLLLMGRQSAGLKQQIDALRLAAGASARLCVHDRFVPDPEFLEAIGAVDVVAVTSSEHTGSSSILLRAAAAGRPVLGADIGWTGRMMRHFRLGYCCNPRDEASLRAGVAWAFDEPQRDNADAAAFAAAHNPAAQFQATVLRETVER